MNESHICDPTLRTVGPGPITQSRALRMLRACIDNGTDTESSVADVLFEVDGCTDCLAGLAIELASRHAILLSRQLGCVDALAELDSELLNSLDELGPHRGEVN